VLPALVTRRRGTAAAHVAMALLFHCVLSLPLGLCKATPNFRAHWLCRRLLVSRGFACAQRTASVRQRVSAAVCCNLTVLMSLDCEACASGTRLSTTGGRA